jgi:hypothetical protein
VLGTRSYNSVATILKNHRENAPAPIGEAPILRTFAVPATTTAKALKGGPSLRRHLVAAESPAA